MAKKAVKSVRKIKRVPPAILSVSLTGKDNDFESGRSFHLFENYPMIRPIKFDGKDHILQLPYSYYLITVYATAKQFAINSVSIVISKSKLLDWEQLVLCMLPNTYADSGRVCWGCHAVKDVDISNFYDEVVALFWSSAFNHDIGVSPKHFDKTLQERPGDFSHMFCDVLLRHLRSAGVEEKYDRVLAEAVIEEAPKSTTADKKKKTADPGNDAEEIRAAF